MPGAGRKAGRAVSGGQLRLICPVNRGPRVALQMAPHTALSLCVEFSVARETDPASEVKMPGERCRVLGALQGFPEE